MNTHELIAASAAIAGPLATTPFNSGQMTSDRINEIARTAVQIAKEIEKEARKAYTAG